MERLDRGAITINNMVRLENVCVCGGLPQAFLLNKFFDEHCRKLSNIDDDRDGSSCATALVGSSL